VSALACARAARAEDIGSGRLLVGAVVSVVALATPGPGDATTQKYLGLAQAELQAVTAQANNISSEISGLQSQLSALQETQAELNRLISDLQNP
jgi:uncharacterized protein involved in exopolysaccharide biosynthesis